MQVIDPQAVLQKLGEKSLKIDSYFLRRTGFLANQSILRLGEYNLNCVPAALGREESRFLVALTPNEVSLFSQFKDGTHLLMLTFDDPGNDIARFPLKVGLVDIVPVPERKGICLLSFKMKSMPTEFVLFLGTYIEDLEARLEAWETYSAEVIPYAPAMVQALGLGHKAVLIAGDQKFPVDIADFHTKRLGLVAGEAAVPAGPCQLQITLQGKALNLAGVYDSAAFLPEFSPDWLDFVQRFLFRRQFLQQKAARQSS